MNIEVHPHFRKNYRKRIFTNSKLVDKVKERIALFSNNPKSPLLKDHQLTGDMKGYRAFSVTGDIRIVYFREDDTVWLFDIGTHNQVYM